MAESTTFEATIQQTEPLTVAFQVLEGAYDQIPKGFERLYGWLGPRGHEASGPPIVVYLTDPETPEGQARFETWAPIEDAATQFGPDYSGLGIKQVESMTVAMARHIGPYEKLGDTYGQLQQWISDHGHEVAGPAMEIYLTSPDEASPEQYVTEVLIPVREL